MSIFTSISKITHKTLYFTEDLKAKSELLAIDDRFILRKEKDKKQAWPFIPSITLPLTFNGNYKGEYYLISSRTGEPLDPLGKLGDDWKGKNIWKKICELANEEHHKIVSKVHESRMAKATMPLAVGAGVFTIIVGLIAFTG